MGNYDESSCENCDASLVQLGGDWYCPDCDDMPGESFTLDTSDDADFVV